jgi:hypothetical protein
MLFLLNSYNGGVCGDVSNMAATILKNYYSDVNTYQNTGFAHVVGNLPNRTIFDVMTKIINYKGNYQLATREDLIADVKLFLEPTRKTAYGDFVYNDDSWHPNDWTTLYALGAVSSYDNLTMQMPEGASFIYPVKSANTINTTAEVGVAAMYVSNLIMTIPTSKIGVIKMPFALSHVDGEGQILFKGVTYDIPADKAALITKLELWDDFNYTFEILTNTAGLTAEFICSNKRTVLFNKNTINKTTLSGSVKVEKVPTDNIIPTFQLIVNKGTASRWTVDMISYFNNNKSVKLPLMGTLIYDQTRLYFEGSTTRPEPQYVYNKTVNTITNKKAGTAVIDQCFASKLMPVNDTFTTSLELSFTTYDGSNCYYTIDDTTPDATKTLYTAPFSITATKTVKWINIKADYANSHVNSRVITKL